jgi:hypothetical protein
MRMKMKLEKLAEYHENTPAARRKQIKLNQEFGQFLRWMSSEERERVFGEDNDEQIWTTLNTVEEYRTKVIEWLDAKITEGITKGFEEMAEKYRDWIVQDTYRISKSAAMKRYINKKESPPCPIEEGKIYDYFQEAWGQRNKPSMKRMRTHHFICDENCQRKMFRKR